jgi:hypothetical protein
VETLVIIRNRSTKVESEITMVRWREIKNSSLWAGVFERVKTIKEPPEVVALNARKAAGGAKKIS